MSGQNETVHGTCVALGSDGDAVLLRGVPGSGKSDLALRFLAAIEGSALVADDQTALARQQDTIVASAPAALAGLLEVRGLGLVTLPAVSGRLRLLCDLTAANDAPRIAEPRFEDCLGISLPVLPLWPFSASAPLKLALALASIGRGGRAGFPGEDGRLFSAETGAFPGLALGGEPPHDGGG